MLICATLQFSSLGSPRREKMLIANWEKIRCAAAAKTKSTNFHISPGHKLHKKQSAEGGRNVIYIVAGILMAVPLVSGARLCAKVFIFISNNHNSAARKTIQRLFTIKRGMEKVAF